MGLLEINILLCSFPISLFLVSLFKSYLFHSQKVFNECMSRFLESQVNLSNRPFHILHVLTMVITVNYAKFQVTNHKLKPNPNYIGSTCYLILLRTCLYNYTVTRAPENKVKLN